MDERYEQDGKRWRQIAEKTNNNHIPFGDSTVP